MTGLQLEEQEIPILDGGDGDDEPMWAGDFVSDRLSSPAEVFSVSFVTGREWESEETDGGGFTIRTKPDPRLTVYDTDNGMVFAMAASTPEPMVYSAILASHTRQQTLVERIVEGFEEGYDGIEQIADIRAVEGYEHFADAARAATDRVVPQ